MELFPLDLPSILAFAERAGWGASEDREHGQLGLQKEPGDWLIRVIPRPDRRMLSLGVVLPTSVPEERISEFCRAISLANSSTYMGAWVLTHERRAAYFRLTLPAGSLRYDDDSLAFWLEQVLATARSRAPVLEAVARGDAPASSVLRA